MKQTCQRWSREVPKIQLFEKWGQIEIQKTLVSKQRPLRHTSGIFHQVIPRVEKIRHGIPSGRLTPANCSRRCPNPLGFGIWWHKYLNNIVEQDHRFIKRRVAPGLGFFSFRTAWRTLRGYEAMNMIRKGQIKGTEKEDVKGQVKFIENLFGLAS